MKFSFWLFAYEIKAFYQNHNTLQRIDKYAKYEPSNFRLQYNFPYG